MLRNLSLHICIADLHLLKATGGLVNVTCSSTAANKATEHVATALHCLTRNMLLF